MKLSLAVLLVASVLSVSAVAKERHYEQCTLTAMNSVPCGSQQKRHKKTREMLCQEYVVQTDSTEYHIRQKQEKHTDILPIPSQGEFRIEKDTMRLRIPAGTGKELDYQIVSVAKR